MRSSTASSKRPLNSCIVLFDSRTNYKKQTHESVSVFLVNDGTRKTNRKTDTISIYKIGYAAFSGMGISHSLKTCHRHVFLTAFRFPYGQKKKATSLYPSTTLRFFEMPLSRHGNLPRPKNVPLARFLNGLSIPVRQKIKAIRMDGFYFLVTRTGIEPMLPP